MDKFINIKYSENYVENVKESIFTQKSSENKIEKTSSKKYNRLFDCILYTNDSDSLLKMDDYVEKTKIGLAVKMDENSEHYDSYKYNKNFKKKLVQKNIQKDNFFSSLLYLCDVYKINIQLFDGKELFSLNNKYENVKIYFVENNKWNIHKIPVDVDSKKITTQFVDKYFKDDLNGNYNVYDIGLESISKYKLNRLQKISEKNSIQLKNGKKNKTKKQLYDELYLLGFNLILQ
jgi:hypothetical protein